MTLTDFLNWFVTTDFVVSPLRTAAVPEQQRDGHILQKLSGQKQNTSRELQQVNIR